MQRIDRFVKRIQTEGFQPDPSALANFKVALESRWHVDAQRKARLQRERKAGFVPRPCVGQRETSGVLTMSKQ